MNFVEIQRQVKKQEFAPVYYLYGEETYFIDKLAHQLEHGVLDPTEEAFNKEVFFGPETTASKVLNACRSFPMMATRRLVMLKEGQRMDKREVEKLGNYFKAPAPTTVFVMLFKGKKGLLPRKFEKVVAEKGGVLFHAKKMYERDVRNWLTGYLQDLEVEVESGIADLLIGNLGTNLNLIENEIGKMVVYLQATGQPTLTKDYVHEVIGIDKEFNVFELINALGLRQASRAHLIIDRLTQNPKNNPPVLIVSNLFRYFDNVARVYDQKLNDPRAIQQSLKANWFQANDYLSGRKNYNLSAVYRNLGYIQQADMKIKGITPTLMPPQHTLKTLIWQLLS
ncbi:MAG: DNA polymerase III subunit delta [Bacteroidota bacterium]